MEMRVLTSMGRWLLDQQGLKQQLGDSLWQEAFDACGSPSEWQEFSTRHQDTRSLAAVWEQFGRLNALWVQVAPGRTAKPVDIPAF